MGSTSLPSSSVVFLVAFFHVIGRRFGMRYLVVCQVLFFSGLVNAETASQTDWSGGPGVPGPVPEWSSDFYIDTGCCYQEAGDISLPQLPSIPASHGVAADFTGAWALAAGDINADGYPDIAASAYWGDQIAWWESDGGSPPEWSFHLVSNDYDECQNLALADIDGDGDLDILGSSSSLTEITLWSSTGGSSPTFSRTTVIGDVALPVTADPVDIDGDGDLDVLALASLDEELFWMENCGGSPPSWTKRMVDTPVSPFSATALDMDGDGDMDLCCNHDHGSFCYNIIGYENLGGTPVSWSPFNLAWDESYCKEIFAADISGDGLPDLVTANVNSNHMSWLENLGVGYEWTTHEFNWYHNGCSVRAWDLDQDGDVDIAAASLQDQDSVIWFENTGNPWSSSWPEHSVPETATISVRCFDIDDDGLTDLVTSQPFDDSINWYSIVGYPPSGEMESSILDTGYDVVQWGDIDWSGETQGETSIAFSVRSGQSPYSMGPWSEWLTSPCSLSPFLQSYRYMQYRTLLESNCPSLTPSLQQIEVSYNQESIEEGEAPSTETIAVTSPNPSSSSYLVVDVVCSGTETASISLFNCAGRLQASLCRELPDGSHTLMLPTGVPGVYFYRIAVGGDLLEGRMVVTR